MCERAHNHTSELCRRTEYLDDECYYEKCVIKDVPQDVHIQNEVCPPEPRNRADAMITATLAEQLNVTTYAGPLRIALVDMLHATPDCLRYPNPQLDGPYAGGVDLFETVYDAEFSNATSLRRFAKYNAEHEQWDTLASLYLKCSSDVLAHSEVVMDLGSR